MQAVHGSYEGMVNKQANEIEGTWTQGQSFPLKLSRVEETMCPAAMDKIADWILRD